MTSRDKRLTKHWQLFVMLLLTSSAVFLSGCSFLSNMMQGPASCPAQGTRPASVDGQYKVGESPMPDSLGPQPHPMLAAARARRINMFGDVGDRDEQSRFASRAALSLRQHTFTEVGKDSDPNPDPAGSRIVFASTRHNIRPGLYIKSVDGVAVTQLTGDPASDIQPAFSPDGTRVAFASDRSGQWDIWIIDANGGLPVQVTSGLADEVHPSWSRDGNKLVFCSLPPEGGQWELWTADAEAGGTKKFIGYGLFPEWSKVEDKIVFQRARERGSHRFSVWTLTLVDGEPRYPTEVASDAAHALILPTFSADGRRIAYASVADPNLDVDQGPTRSLVVDIWMMNADGRGKTRLTDGHTANHSPAFSSDGRIYFTSDRNGRENVWSLLPAKRLTRNADDGGRHATPGRSSSSPWERPEAQARATLMQRGL